MKHALLTVACLGAMPGSVTPAQQVPVTHPQVAMHRYMTVRSGDGKNVAHGEFTQDVQGDQVIMHLSYKFADGSFDDETTTYLQQGTFHLVRNHHLQQGPFFPRPSDFTIDASTGTATTRTADGGGTIHVQTEHMQFPRDVSNGLIGTLLLNVPQDTKPFRVGLLAPVRGGRLIRLLISRDSVQSFHAAGQMQKATVFRIHPELGGVVGVIAKVIGLQPKDVMVWVLEGHQPAIVRIVGQLGGYGPVVSSELDGTSYDR